jgi:hypothetical protein
VGSLALLAGLGALATVGAGDVAVAVGIRLTALAFLALTAAIVLGWSPFVPLSLGLLGAAYATRLALDDPSLDTGAPLFGAGLLLTAELAYWSLEERDGAVAEPGEQLRRLALVVGLALGALAAGAGLLAIADVAAAAAAAALLVVVLLARRAKEA